MRRRASLEARRLLPALHPAEGLLLALVGLQGPPRRHRASAPAARE